MAGFGLPSSPEIVTTFFCRPCANTSLRDDLVRGYHSKVRERIEVYELDGRPFDHHDLPTRLWEPDDDAYRDYLELHGLSVQLTEALAEYWHARVRAELGLGGDGDVDAMIRDQAYRGSRYSFGYPACPDLADRAKLVTLLRPERIGVQLSEELQLHPEQSTDALVVHHQEAKYFNAR